MRTLEPTDYDEATAILLASQLIVEDLAPESMTAFLGIMDGDALAAIGGLEMHGSDALLRSIATRPDSRNMGYATVIVGGLEARARENGVERVYLLTDTAAAYFERLGYGTVSRERAPGGIAATGQFRQLCPDTAAFMVKPLDGRPEST